jgi:hypothetical protein
MSLKTHSVSKFIREGEEYEAADETSSPPSH